MPAIPETTKNMHSWFQHPVFDRYWRHYSYMQNWFHHHVKSQQRARHGFHHINHNEIAQRNYHHTCPESSFNPNIIPSCNWQQFCTSQHYQDEGIDATKTPPEINPEEYDSEGDTEYEMEITADMIAVIEHAEKHRQERRAQLEAEGEEYADMHYIELGDLPVGGINKLSNRPPSEKAKIFREEQMNELYGEKAAMIHGMETAMQLTFDRYCDLKQPKMWPIIPLRL